MERGFDEFFGFLHGGHSYMSPTSNATNPLYDGKKIVNEPAYLTDVLADRAVDFINRNRTQPFFLYLAFNAVHVPMQATEKYLNRFAGISDRRRRTYAAMLSAMDDGIGKTLAALDHDRIGRDVEYFERGIDLRALTGSGDPKQDSFGMQISDQFHRARQGPAPG